MKSSQIPTTINDYYASVKARHNDMNRELEATQAELASVRAEYDREKAIHRQMMDSAPKLSLSTSKRESDHLDVVSLLNNRVGSLERYIGQFQPRFQKLRRIIEAPVRFEQAQTELVGLVEQRTSLAQERKAAEALVAKLSQVVADLQASLLSAEKSATVLLTDSDADFNLPEALIKIEVELRLAKPALADAQNKLAEIVTRTKDLQELIKESERLFVDARYVMVEIELHAHLLPIMNLFARATVARHQFDFEADLSKFDIDIPRELIAPAELELAAELPTA